MQESQPTKRHTPKIQSALPAGDPQRQPKTRLTRTMREGTRITGNEGRRTTLAAGDPFDMIPEAVIPEGSPFDGEHTEVDTQTTAN